MDHTTAVDALEQTWTSIASLAADLDDEQWRQPTACPGWTVQDQVAHMAGLEARLAGRPAPDHDLPDDLPHVRDDVARTMEVDVDYRRQLEPAAVLAEFREVTAERLEQLRATDSAGIDLGNRILDCWVHDQDIRDAVDRPGNADGLAARITRDRFVAALGYVLGKKVGPSDGTTVALTITGALGLTTAVTVIDGRGRTIDPPDDPDASLTMDLGTFTRLCAGRVDPAGTVDEGAVTVSGDLDLAQRFLEQMAVTP